MAIMTDKPTDDHNEQRPPIPSEKAKIFIEGPSAYETTAIGIKITYSNVEYTDKGAFILTDSSKDVRSWFIGAISLLQVGNYKYFYDCK